MKIEESCELLMSYPIPHIFSDGTVVGNKSMLKAETRCTKVVDSYWSICNPTHMHIRQRVNNIKTILTLCCNNTPVEELCTSFGELQYYYKQLHSKVVNSSKSEPLLKEYHKGVMKPDFSKTLISLLETLSETFHFTIDVKACMMLYKQSMKDMEVSYG